MEQAVWMHVIAVLANEKWLAIEYKSDSAGDSHTLYLSHNAI